MPQHTLSLLMQDRPGVLHRAVSLLRRRAVNIVCLSVGPSEFPGLSRMTVVIEGERSSLVTSQLDRLVEVLAVSDEMIRPAMLPANEKLEQTPTPVNGQADGIAEEDAA